jgi:hypothetical protein
VGRWKIILKNNLKKVFEFVIFAQLVDYRIDALEFFFSKDRSDEKKARYYIYIQHSPHVKIRRIVFPFIFNTA